MTPFETCELTGVKESSEFEFPFADFVLFLLTCWSDTCCSATGSIFYTMSLNIERRYQFCKPWGRSAKLRKAEWEVKVQRWLVLIAIARSRSLNVNKVNMRFYEN